MNEIIINDIFDLYSAVTGESGDDILVDDVAMLVARRVYKDTECGACFAATSTGIRVSGYVEGWDGACPSHDLIYPFTHVAFWGVLSRCDEEADVIWKETHGCEDCWHGNEDYGPMGNRQVDPDCPTCGGGGIVI